MYLSSILWMLSWPVVLIVAYQAVKLMEKKFGSKLENQKEE